MRAAIALEKMTNEGIHLDLSHLNPLRANLYDQLSALLNQIRNNQEWLYLEKERKRRK